MAVSQAIPITRHPYADGSYKKMLIDGQWVDAASGKKFETLNPATGEVLATVAEGDAEDINRAVAAARRAFEGPWSRVKPFERQNLLLKLADLVEKNFEELSQLDTLDMGAPISRTRGNRLRVLGMLRYYAGQATSIHGETIENSLPGEVFSYTLKEPVGVVGAIIPWNGPLGASVWKIGPAIATGCTVILKPAEEAPLTSLRLAELCMEAGIPAGVVNVVPGFGETAGAALASHPGVDKVAFTGSHVTGQSIVRASAGNLKRVSLELGGKSPDIVFADADLDAAVPGAAMAVPGAAMAVFANSGQICSAGTRLFVESKIYDEFVGRVAEFGKKLNVGNGLDPNTQIGPLVSQQQLERVSGYLDIGQKEGAKALAGGARLTEGALSKGYFVPPTVFANVQDNMRIAQEEIFGPVISAISFKDSDDLIKRANATTFGLGSGVWTTNVSKAHQVAKSLRAGSVWVNCYQAMDPAVPFGGYKMSGYGRESGKQHVEEYLNVKAVWVETA
jgi:aldehyde dehydrogenase (NAD+)